MPEPNLTLGIALIVGGPALLLLALLLLRAVPKSLSQTYPVLPGLTPPAETNSSGEAVLLVQEGGRVVYINAQAREWFELGDDEPNLERLARRARPSDTFLGMCGSETSARLSLGGYSVEASSYFAPFGGTRAILVTLRRPHLLLDYPGSESQGEAASGVISIFTELGQAITASLNLEETLLATLEGVERIIPFETAEINIWESDSRLLRPYRLEGVVGVDRRLEKPPERYQEDQGLTGFLFTQRQSLRIGDMDSFTEVRPAVDRQRVPFRAYLGVPLLVAGEVVGTLELGSLSRDSFSQNDEYMLSILAGQAAVAVHNALLYQTEQQRARELEGLANLAQAVHALRDPQDLFQRLLEAVSPLLDVEVLGFLIFDESRRVLAGQIPFQGLPPEVVEEYSVPIPPGSPAEAVWHSGEMIAASDALSDRSLETLGLNYITQAASIRHTVLAPLSSSGRMIGYLQVATRRDGSPFDKNDLRLLSIIAGQAGPLIENAALVQQSRRRAHRSETLRRIASLTGSAATIEEILKYSLLDLARLVQADIAAIYLLDEHRGELRLHKDSAFGLPPEAASLAGRMGIDDPQYGATVTHSQRHLVYAVDDEMEKLPIHRPLFESLEVKSLVAVPLVVRDRGVGEVALGSSKPNFFTRDDVISAATAASQIAAAIDQAALASQTDASLRERVDQLVALNHISRDINSTVELRPLIQRVYDELLRTTNADCGTIWVFEIGSWARENPVTIVQLGDPGGECLTPIEEFVLLTGESLRIGDYQAAGDELNHGSGSLPAALKALGTIAPAHPDVRSALIVPIAYQGEAAGLIHLHSAQAGNFEAADQEITETLAIQAAIALGNAHRYFEQVSRSELLNRRVETLSKLFETAQILQKEQPLEETLEAIAFAVQAATPFDFVLISVYDAASGLLQRTASAGLPLTTMAELRAHPQSWNSILKLCTPEFQLGSFYFIPHEQMPLKPVDLQPITLLEGNGALRDGQQWHPRDLLLLPLTNGEGQPLGLISVDGPRNSLRPDRPTIETLEIFGAQAALAIENLLKVQSLRSRVAGIEQDLERAQKTALSAQSHLPVLLHKDLEQTLTIQNLSQRARRITAGLDIAELVNRVGSREEVLLALGQEFLSRMGMDVVLIAEPGQDGESEKGKANLRLTRTLGAVPDNVKPESLLGQRNPLRYCQQTRQSLLVGSLTETEWKSAPLLHALDAQAFICLPILLESRVDAILLAVSRTSTPPFHDEDEQLFSLLMRQVAIALQNLNLLEETRRRLQEVNLLLDFSRQLGSLDPGSILHNLVDSALRVVPAAQTGLVALWDPSLERLVPQAATGYHRDEQIMALYFAPGEGIAGQAFLSGKAIRLAEINFARHINLTPENMLLYRDACAGRTTVSCLVVPIIGSSGERGSLPTQPWGVLVLENFVSPGAFTAEDQALITSLTQQTALTLENARLYQASRQRAQQMQTLTEVASTITSSLEPDELITTLLDQMQAILPYNTGILWLRSLEPGRQVMTVRAARGFADSDQRVGLSAAVEDSQLLHEMTVTGMPIYVPNVQNDPRFPALLEFEYLSWLGVPLISSSEVIGVIALEKTEPNFYQPEHIQIVTTFASQAAVALENASLYQESLRRAGELDQHTQVLVMLNRLSSELSGSLDVDHILDYTVKELHQALSCSLTSALLFDASGKPVLRAEYPHGISELPCPVPSAHLFERMAEALGTFNCESARQEPDLEPLDDFLMQRRTHGLLAVPLATGSKLHGLLLAHSDYPYRFDPDEVELARTIANQVAITVENANLFEETRVLTEDLEQRVQERTEELAREHMRTETLLRIITELSASLDLDQVLQRTLRVLNEMIDAEQITVMIARPGERKLTRVASVGYTEPITIGGSPTSLDNNEGLAGWVIWNRQPVLIPNILEDERWIPAKDAFPTQHRSALAVPLMLGAESLGAMLLFHREPDHFSSDQMELVQAAGNQVAVAVNNAELYRLIRDQAEDLGSMLRSQQVETSRSKAILEAVADGVLVTDANRRITLFNASAEKILGMDRSQVMGKSLEYFTGLFGKAAHTWRETIATWSLDPTTYQPGDTFSEQITLENGSVVSVRLAPVIMRSDFLGTVSIFSDITHQVEVDRLKSEFVATVSHELRTPMTSIKGYVEILLMGAAGPVNDQQRRFLETVKTNTERLGVLVNDLLDISRIEAGRIRLAVEPLDMSQVVNEVLEDLQRRSKEENRSIQIVKRIPSNLPRVAADPERMRQIVENLIDNAYQYNYPDGKITIAIHQVGKELHTDVIDTGVGIPLKEQNRVFERFFRGEGPLVLGVAGTGLGLSIVQNLVQMHQGRIWLSSSGVPGEGSQFSFSLPIYISADGEE
jgi:PAS domain S-box-containing protein